MHIFFSSATSRILFGLTRAQSRASRGFASSPTRASVMSNRTALVTGAARGIGRSIALRLASDGFNICIADLPVNADLMGQVESEIRALGREATTTFCDVTKIHEVEGTVQKSVESLGPLNVFVANAGISRVSHLLDTTETDMRQMFETNVFGVINSNIAAAKQFIKQGGSGKIINAASIASYRPFVSISVYSSTKAAVRSLTQGFALELAPHGITVNAYGPGYTDTQMTRDVDATLAKMNGVAPGELFRAGAKTIALGRTGTGEDISKVVSFLAGPDSDYLTGQTILVDGGVVFA
ncbi:acetoin dehydrogenase-like protein [Marasmius fiardii PR-910]|nr:acetoin dehydrogenase-like protein [Marasmius fiardii PR-910]